MTTLREAAQMALDALEFETDYDTAITLQKAAIEALRAALATDQEPVAWLYKKKDGMQVITDDPDYADGTWTPLYTVPPQRDDAPAKAVEWQGLTDEERALLAWESENGPDCVEMTEFKLWEKNR